MLFFEEKTYSYIGDGMIDKIHNYINNPEFSFTVYEDKIYIVNFKRILSLEEEYISLQSTKEKISIKGKNLVLKKLLSDEMLISGQISKIEVFYE